MIKSNLKSSQPGGGSNKGFTLVELLAVIVILAILVIIAVPSVIKMLNNTKKNAFSVEAENIIKSAKNAYSNRELNGEANKYCYTLSELSEYVDKDFTGYTGSVYIDPSTDTYKIWISKKDFIINGSNSGDISVVELSQLQPASTTCEDIEIIACTTNKHNLYVNAYGGVFTDSQNLKTYEMLEGNTQEIEEPTKAGYTFSRWQVIGTPSSFQNDIIEMGSENIILNAEWINNAKTLTINANGGVWNGASSWGVLPGDHVDLEEPTKIGYTFNGWRRSNSDIVAPSVDFIMGSENELLVADWTPNTYTIAYDCNNGKGIMENSTHTYGIESPLATSKCFKIWPMTISTIIGWAKSVNATQIDYEPSELVTDVIGSGTQTLYAMWDDVGILTYSGSYTVLDDEEGNWRIKFWSSGTLTFIRNPGLLDVFVVGGGGGTRDGWSGGAGGGYTTTQLVDDIENISYPVVIGGGGGRTINARGGTSSALGVSAAGGYGIPNESDVGGSGGSGGASYVGGVGGSDGSNGSKTGSRVPGTGQHRTTREFGEADGDLYAGGGGSNEAAGGAGGGGNGYGSRNGVPNTGGGAGGNTYGGTPTGGIGGSGIVIIRNHREIIVD